MGFKEDIESEVSKILRETWVERKGNVIPDSSNVKLGNEGVWLDATVLYADMADSTALVDNKKAQFSAEVYKTFLFVAAKLIRSEDGEITAYDGDRVMAVFIGDNKNSNATRAALKINYARIHIINPAIKIQYKNINYELKHVVGIDTSKVFVARTGIRGANDLVWVGRAANHAAKLSTLSSEYSTRITSEVFSKLNASLKVTDGQSMWEPVTWTSMQRQIYRSNWIGYEW